MNYRQQELQKIWFYTSTLTAIGEEFYYRLMW